jgi:exosome complex component CSL4
MADVKSGDAVVPGDPLCVIEEFSGGYGTFEEEGIVYAATSGGVVIDLKGRSIMVLSPEGKIKLALPVKGDILVGEVASVYDQRAEITLVKKNDVLLFSPLIGEVHISNVTRRFVKSMHDVLAPTDLVRATAINTHEIPVHLSLVGPDLGVIYAKCTKCGHPLSVTTYNNMICLNCEYRFTREVTKDYGLGFGLEPRPDLAPRTRRRPYSDQHGGGYGGRSSDRGGPRRPRDTGRRRRN